MFQPDKSGPRKDAGVPSRHGRFAAIEGWVYTRPLSRLLRSRAFENMRIRERYWQVIIDGTQLYSSREKPNGKYLHRVHNRRTETEYTEYYYYLVS